MRGWRTGPRWYHVVVATLADPWVEQRREDVAEALADLIGPATAGQAHVTVWAAGFGTAPDLPVDRMVTLTVGGPATFASAVYLTVTAPELEHVRRELAARNPPEDRAGTFTPHVTVGLYRRSIPLADAEQRIAALPASSPLQVHAVVEHLVVDTRTDRLCRPPV